MATTVVTNEEGTPTSSSSGGTSSMRRVVSVVGSVFTPYYRLLKTYPMYRWIWYSSIISIMGDYLNYIATLSVLDTIGASNLEISLFLIFRTLPQFLWGPVVGVLVDRYDRLSLMLIRSVFFLLTFLFLNSKSRVNSAI